MLLLLRLAYDGTHLDGCAESPGRRTVEGLLREALGQVGMGGVVDVLAPTEAGSHALAQVAVLSVETSWPVAAWLRTFDRHLPEDLRCHAIAKVQAVPKVTALRYRYRLDTHPFGDPALARHAWKVGVRVEDLAAWGTRCAAAPSLAAFRRGSGGRAHALPKVASAGWSTEAGVTTFTVEGEGLHDAVVRGLVGAQAAAVRGTCTSEELEAALDGHVSRASLQSAPAKGLVLDHVELDITPAWSDAAVG